MSARTYTGKCVDCGVNTGRRSFLAQRCRPCNDNYLKHCRAANAVVSKAVASGALPRAKTMACVDCGRPAFDWDHRDYTKPLDVQPVCRSCNFKRGRAAYPLGAHLAADAIKAA